MVAVLDTRPGVVNVAHYGGDTLTIKVTAPASLVAGMEWAAQVRGTREAAGVDAEFTITPPSVADGPAFLVLPAETTRQLVETGGVAINVSSRVVVQRYSGEWDCQVAGPGGADPVRTLVQGALTIDLDVTREAS